MPAVVIDPRAVRQPEPTEQYIDYLDSFRLFDGTGFVYRELVRNSPRHQLPPRPMWPAMVPTLLLVVELRERMTCAGASGLVIAAAFRPRGGEPDSQHKHNAALDVDLLAADVAREPDLPRRFAAISATLWLEHRQLRCGLGTYAADGLEVTRRVHLDTNSRYGWRCWQGLPGGGFSRRPAALRLARLDEHDPAVRACIADGQPRFEGS